MRFVFSSFYNKKNGIICLGSRNRLDKSNRPSRSILKTTEIDTRRIGCGSLLGRLDLSDRKRLNSYKRDYLSNLYNPFDFPLFDHLTNFYSKTKRNKWLLKFLPSVSIRIERDAPPSSAPVHTKLRASMLSHS
jgi:hypothetical protein